MTSILSRGLSALSPLLVVPVALDHLGSTTYGVWATAVSLTSFVGFADLGIGTGLMTRLGALQDLSGNGRESRRLVGSAYSVTTAIVAFALFSLAVSVHLLNWGALLGVDKTRHGVNVNFIVLITFAAVILNVLASLVVRVQYAIGQQGQSNLWQTAGTASGLVGALTVAHIHRGPDWFVAAAAFGPVAVAALNTIVFFAVSPRGRVVRPRVRDGDLATMKSLMGLGSRFLVISVLMTACVAGDPWIVAKTASLSQVPAYAISYRVFSLISTVAVMATIPLWPIHSQALASGDTEWVRQTTRRMTVAVTAIVGILCAVAIISGTTVMRLWLGDRIEVDLTLWLGLALWCCVQTATGAAFMVLNGAEVLKPQVAGYAALLLIGVPLKWVMSGAWGPWTIPWVGSILYCLFIFPACYFGYRVALGRAITNERIGELVV